MSDATAVAVAEAETAMAKVTAPTCLMLKYSTTFAASNILTRLIYFIKAPNCTRFPL